MDASLALSSFANCCLPASLLLTCSSRWLCRLALVRGVFTGPVPKCASGRITAVLELIPQHKSLKQYSAVLALLRHLTDPSTWHSGLQAALRLATPGLQVGECMALDSWLKRASCLLSRSSPPPSRLAAASLPSPVSRSTRFENNKSDESLRCVGERSG